MGIRNAGPKGRVNRTALGAAVVALVAVAWLVGATVASPRQVHASGPPEHAQPSATAQIYQLQANFHRAKTFRDIELMMSLWAPDATLTQGTTIIQGTDALRAFWLTTGSFNTALPMRESLSPSFKIKVQTHGDTAFLYFECHDVDEATGAFVSHLWLAGTVKHVDGHWLFWQMNGAPIKGGWDPNAYYFTP